MLCQCILMWLGIQLHMVFLSLLCNWKSMGFSPVSDGCDHLQAVLSHSENYIEHFLGTWKSLPDFHIGGIQDNVITQTMLCKTCWVHSPLISNQHIPSTQHWRFWFLNFHPNDQLNCWSQSSFSFFFSLFQPNPCHLPRWLIMIRFYLVFFLLQKGYVNHISLPNLSTTSYI